MNAPGRASGFIAENEPVTGSEDRVPQRSVTVRRQEPEPFRAVGRDKKGLPVFVMPEIELLPVVHSGPPEVSIGDGETERMDQVQPKIGKGAESPDVSGVLGNLRTDKDEMKKRGNGRHG